jgi:hypothetical protein
MNLIEILKNCPKGMKLYSPIFGEVEFRGVNESTGKIACRNNDGKYHSFLSDGKYEFEGECMLFPSKEQRDWNDFMIPFKDGDVIIRTEFNPGCKQYNIAIFSNYNANATNRMTVHCQVNGSNEFKTRMNICHRDWRLANAEEIQNFMTRMHESGYDFKDGKLTRLFKYGDVIAFRNETWGGYNIGIFDKYLNDTFCKVLCISLVSDGSVNIVDKDYNIGRGWDTKRARHATDSEKLDLLEKLAKIGYKWNNNELTPIAKFKVGDTITNGTFTFRIDAITNTKYIEFQAGDPYTLDIAKQDEWKIKKFDIHSLKPYDKVLVRFEDGAWYPTLVSYVNSAGQVYLIDCEEDAKCVIPFEGNERLIGEYDDPDPYYITW